MNSLIKHESHGQGLKVYFLPDVIIKDTMYLLASQM